MQSNNLIKVNTEIDTAKKLYKLGNIAGPKSCTFWPIPLRYLKILIINLMNILFGAVSPNIKKYPFTTNSFYNNFQVKNCL